MSVFKFRKAIKARSEGKMQAGCFTELCKRTYFHTSRHDCRKDGAGGEGTGWEAKQIKIDECLKSF